IQQETPGPEPPVRVPQRLRVGARSTEEEISKGIVAEIVVKEDDAALAVLLPAVDLRANCLRSGAPSMVPSHLLNLRRITELVLRPDNRNRRRRPQPLNDVRHEYLRSYPILIRTDECRDPLEPRRKIPHRGGAERPRPGDHRGMRMSVGIRILP